jgi:hypothetical protein
MTSYNKRDLRAADLLAMILVGLGVIFVWFAVDHLVSPLGFEARFGKRPDGSRTGLGLCVSAVSFLLLGTALNFKVRQLTRTGGREPKDYEGVPE